MKIGIVKEDGLAGSDKRAVLLPGEVKKIVRAGHKVFVEKGLDETISSVYSSRKAKNFIMTSDWNWFNFLKGLKNRQTHRLIDNCRISFNMKSEPTDSLPSILRQMRFMKFRINTFP